MTTLNFLFFILFSLQSQRSFRQRLQLMETKATKKEKKKCEENARLEQLSIRERKIEMKRRQRLEVCDFTLHQGFT